MHSNMNEPQMRYAERKKPDTKDSYTPYASTYVQLWEGV